MTQALVGGVVVSGGSYRPLEWVSSRVTGASKQDRAVHNAEAKTKAGSCVKRWWCRKEGIDLNIS